MYEIFNVRRFALLFRKNLLERPAQITGLCVLNLLVSLLIYFFCKIMSGFEEAQNASFMIGLIGGGSFMASMVYGHFSSYANGTSFLTLPASAFEKWLCGIIIAGILYPTIFLLFFLTMDLLFVSQYHRNLDPAAYNYRYLYDAVYRFQLSGFPARAGYMFFLNITGLMLTGSLYFNKAAFIKVALIVCGLFFITFTLNYIIASSLFQHLDNANPFHNVFLKAGNDIGKVDLPAPVFDAIDIIAMGLLPCILWLLPYLRLKEKEV